MIAHHSFKIQNVIQSELFAANHSIKVCVAWFTNDLLFQPLLLKLRTGVEVDIILNKDDVNLSETNKVNFEQFTQLGGRLHWNTSKKLLHHKFCIIDDRVVISGSYNWTNKAEYNHENITVYTDEQNTVSYFENVFVKLLQEFSKTINISNVNIPKTGKDGKINSSAYSVIEYTSLDGKIVEPNCDAVFDGVIVSNIYDKRKNKGFIIFDRVIRVISGQAFFRCANLSSVIIPVGVEIIDGFVFCGCDNLEKVTIPESIKQIGINTFGGCKSLVKFEGALVSEDGRCIVINNELVAFSPRGLEEYTIPNGIKTIGAWAFANCKHLKKVTIPISVTNIREVAFCNCTSLSDIILPENITHIGYWAFSGCKSLTNITIPDSVIEIEDAPFEYCESLTQFKGKYASGDGRCLIVDGTLKSFAPYGINEYVIPESVNIIGMNAFCGCEKISNITIANTVTNIGYGAFSNCKSLTSIVIPNGVVELDGYAFLECYNLSTIIIPNSIDKLALSAFITYSLEKNNKLTNIYINNDIPPIINHDNKLSTSSEDLDCCRFLVPIKSVSTYKNADVWKEYAVRIFGFSF